MRRRRGVKGHGSARKWPPIAPLFGLRTGARAPIEQEPAHEPALPPTMTSPARTPASDASTPARTSPRTAQAERTIIANRGEFVDALHALRKGHVLVRVSEAAGGCVLDGSPVYHSYPTLARYGLIDEFHNPHGFAQARYFRLSERGRAFADRACAAWRSRPLWQRLAVRLVG
jgi:hypothetical protein